MDILTEKHFERQTAEEKPAVMLYFKNFTREDFTHSWNGVPYTFKAGKTYEVEAGIARNFAKHLVNRELLKRGHENDTSPKEPNANPFFMDLYNRCLSDVPIKTASVAREPKADVGDSEGKEKEDGKGEGEKSKPSKESKGKEEGEFEELVPPDFNSED